MPGNNSSTVRHRRKRSGGTYSDSHDHPRKKKSASRKSGFLWIFARIFAGVSCFVVGLILAVLLVAFFTKSPIDPEQFTLPEPPEWTGPLTENTILQKAKQLLKGELSGPEAIALYNGSLYTGTWDGRVVQITDGKVRKEWRFGTPPCSGSYDEEPACGRPLGIRISSRGSLLVADAYLGLFEINVDKSKPERLFSSTTRVAGSTINFLNDLEILKNGTILLTDSSKWDRRRFMYPLLENRGDGRLLAFNPSTKKMFVLADGLYFPNGLQLLPDESGVLVAETARARILKYHLVGPKKGQMTVFKDNLAVLPDNIRLSPNGSFWIGGAAPRRRDRTSFLDLLAPYPRLRSLLIKVIPARYLGQLIKYFIKPYGVAIALDEHGEYVSAIHDPTGTVVAGISHVLDTGEELYLGSYHSPYLAVLKYKSSQ